MFRGEVKIDKQLQAAVEHEDLPVVFQETCEYFIKYAEDFNENNIQIELIVKRLR